MLESLFNKVASHQDCNFIKESPTQLFFYEHWEIFRKSYFIEHLQGGQKLIHLNLLNITSEIWRQYLSTSLISFNLHLTHFWPILLRFSGVFRGYKMGTLARNW